ncbi:uncharacterized protein [Amphiura filiformis]|uniref:uncharacterized protein n=1 Tax=Amphiura filiformis TaxID=82378 RepID=UPI003B212417
MEEKKQLLENEWTPSTMLVEILTCKEGNSSSRRYSVFSLGLTFFLLLFAETLILALLAWIISLQLGVDIKNISDSYKGKFSVDPTEIRNPGYSGGLSRDDSNVNCCTPTAIDINQVLKKHVEETVEDHLRTTSNIQGETLEKRSTSSDDLDRNGSIQNVRPPRNPVTPKAHLHPKFQAELLPGYQTPKILTDWTTRTQSSFLDRMSYSDDGYVTVSVSGFYYIYCQISYRQIGSHQSSSSSVSVDNRISSNIVHDIMLRTTASSSSRPTRKLMSNTETPKSNIVSNETYEYSSFMSCVLNLTVGDELYLRAQVPSSNFVIISQYDTTYFGLMLLNER